MAEAEKKEEVKETPAPKKSKLPIILAAVGLVVLLAVGGVAAVVVMKKSDTAANQEVVAPEALADSEKHTPDTVDPELGEGEEPLGAIFPLDNFIVNIEGSRFFRLQVKLEFASPDIPRRFYGSLVPVRDALIFLLSAKRSEDLTTAQGKENLKREIKDKVNEILHREDIKNVYFSQFVIQ